MARERRKPAASDRKRIPKKKTSILTTENISYVDYKDVQLLRRFMSERAKVRARRVTGNSQQQQVAVARAIRIAREMALLPYSVRQVTQRSKGGPRGRDRVDLGDRGDRGDRGELRAPVEDLAPTAAVEVAAEPEGASEAVEAPDVLGEEPGGDEAGE